jgi:hypothetical protein
MLSPRGKEIYSLETTKCTDSGQFKHSRSQALFSSLFKGRRALGRSAAGNSTFSPFPKRGRKGEFYGFSKD